MAKKPKIVSADTTVRLSKIDRERLEVCRSLLLELHRKSAKGPMFARYIEDMSTGSLIGTVIEHMIDDTAQTIKRQWPKQPLETDIRLPLDI